MQLFWTPEAIQSREDIYDFIEQDNPTAALALDEQFEACASRLLDHPAQRRPGRVVGTREWIVHPNDVLVYDVAADAVRVLQVLHAARQWPSR